MNASTPNLQGNDNSIDSMANIAAAVFSSQGIDFATVRRAGGWTNVVWLADELVLRVSTNRESDNLLREARLAALFSPGVGYPTLVDSGKMDGFAWTLAQRLPGRSLGEAWPALSWVERAVALQGLWARVQAVHTVSPEAATPIARKRAWFNSNNEAEAEQGLNRLANDQIITPGEREVLQAGLARFWQALPSAACVLCHGDLTLDNAIWHDDQVIALLDFEFALMAPIQLDLNHLVKCAYGPPADSLSATEAQGIQQLRQVVKDIAVPILAGPNSKVLLVGYATLLELWLLETWLAHPEGEGPLAQWDPYRRLRSLADGRQGYLAPLTQH